MYFAVDSVWAGAVPLREVHGGGHRRALGEPGRGPGRPLQALYAGGR